MPSAFDIFSAFDCGGHLHMGGMDFCHSCVLLYCDYVRRFLFVRFAIADCLSGVRYGVAGPRNCRGFIWRDSLCVGCCDRECLYHAEHAKNPPFGGSLSFCCHRHQPLCCTKRRADERITMNNTSGIRSGAASFQTHRFLPSSDRYRHQLHL